MSLASPFPRGFALDVSQGWRRGPGGHNGVDLRAPVGTPLLAMGDGRVSLVLDAAGGGRSGNAIGVTTDDGAFYSFSHMRDPSPLSRGARVVEGQQLGVVGMTGDTGGPHLHLHVDVAGVDTDPLDVIDPSRASSAGGGALVAGVVLGGGALAFLLWRSHRT